MTITSNSIISHYAAPEPITLHHVTPCPITSYLIPSSDFILLSPNTSRSTSSTSSHVSTCYHAVSTVSFHQEVILLRHITYLRHYCISCLGSSCCHHFSPRPVSSQGLSKAMLFVSRPRAIILAVEIRGFVLAVGICHAPGARHRATTAQSGETPAWRSTKSRPGP